MENNMNIEQLLEAMTAEMGKSPETMVNLSKINEKAVFEHVASKKFAMSGEHIPTKYKILMGIAASAVMGTENCIKNFTGSAIKNNISKEEIVEALLLARFVKATSVISASSEAIKMISDLK